MFRLHFTVYFVVACIQLVGSEFWFDSSQDATASGLDRTFITNIIILVSNSTVVGKCDAKHLITETRATE